ncbi:MAG TPA: hypothetical protein VFI61_02300 [Patescibacteria group bacterium]|nr:hypothetical protein [Patescibacteria group bacterium]
MTLSFFAKPPSYARSNRHILHGSSMIRAQQISEYLGAKLNPVDGYTNDVCIYVKPAWLGPEAKLAKKSYVDIVDGNELIGWLINNPDVSIIVVSDQNRKYLSDNFHPTNKVVLIPQHHCNYERIKRDRSKVFTVGNIGTPSSFMHSVDDFNDRLNNIGMTFVNYSAYRSRMDVVNFYKNIDIQVIYRRKKKILANPLRIINAASFGIPTIAYYEEAFNEMDGYYIPVRNIDEMAAKIEELKNSPQLYAYYAKRGVKMAQEYHIDRIAKLYRKLDKD